MCLERRQRAGRRGVSMRRVIQLLTLLALPLASNASAQVRMDGLDDEWPDGVQVMADGEHLHLRLHWESAVTLQSAPRSTAILLDLDADASTGLKNPVANLLRPSVPAMGIDLAVFLSPPGEGRGPGGLGNGARIEVFDRSGASRKISHADVGFMFLPTYASATTEVRFRRDVRSDLPIASMMKAESGVRGVALQMSIGGKRIGGANVFTGEMPAFAVTASASSDRIPNRPANSLRIVCWNVLWGAPMRTPDGFARVLRSLNPDVVLIQEWDNRQAHEEKITAEMRSAWLNEHMPQDQQWTVIDSAQRGVAIASRVPMKRLELSGLTTSVTSESGALLERQPRFVSAIVTTEHGKAIVASVHLKCCGSMGDWADQTRIAESISINLALRRALRDNPDAACVIAGDMNLVGSKLPLDTLAAGLDTFGVALQVADPVALGDASTHTWQDARSRFTPGRLDYVLSTASKAELLQTFIVDTGRMSPESLEAAGLSATDTDDSDHLPVVVDLRLQKPSL